MKHTPNSQRSVFDLSFLDYVLDMFRRFNQCLGMERGELKLPRERNSFPKVFLKNSFKAQHVQLYYWQHFLPVLSRNIGLVKYIGQNKHDCLWFKHIYSASTNLPILENKYSRLIPIFLLFVSFPVVSWEYLLLLLISWSLTSIWIDMIHWWFCKFSALSTEVFA